MIDQVKLAPEILALARSEDEASREFAAFVARTTSQQRRLAEANKRAFASQESPYEKGRGLAKHVIGFAIGVEKKPISAHFVPGNEVHDQMLLGYYDELGLDYYKQLSDPDIDGVTLLPVSGYPAINLQRFGRLVFNLDSPELSTLHVCYTPALADQINLID